jgi:hypothetical protein
MKSCYIALDLYGAKTMQNQIYMCLFPFNGFFVFCSESIFCPFENTAANITWHYCHLILGLYGV